MTPDEDHAEKIEAVLTHLYDAYPDEHPYSDLQIARSPEGPPLPWILGSSPSSAKIAGKLGLRYCFAAFIRPMFATTAFEEYRAHFEPSPLGAGPDEPRGMIAVNAVCAETDEAAARLRASAEASYARMQRGIAGTTPSVEEAIDELGGVPDPTPARLDDDEWPRSISGGPSTSRGLLEQLSDRVGVDEVMVQNIVPDHAAMLRSHELLAEAVGLESL